MASLRMKNTKQGDTAPIPDRPDRLLTSGVVRERLSYKDRAAFWNFVHASGLPFIRLNARRIMFSERALEDWLARRSSNSPAA